jgi:hypothetical protein
MSNKDVIIEGIPIFVHLESLLMLKSSKENHLHDVGVRFQVTLSDRKKLKLCSKLGSCIMWMKWLGSSRYHISSPTREVLPHTWLSFLIPYTHLPRDIRVWLRGPYSCKILPSICFGLMQI